MTREGEIEDIKEEEKKEKRGRGEGRRIGYR